MPRGPSYASTAAASTPQSYPNIHPSRLAGLAGLDEDIQAFHSTMTNRSSALSDSIELSSKESTFTKIKDTSSTINMDGSGIFVPSYLQKSRYNQKLQQLKTQRDRMAIESKQKLPNLSAQASRQGSATNLLGMKATSSDVNNRGWVHDIIERLTPVNEHDIVQPIPSCWNEADKFQSLEIHPDHQIRLQGVLRTPDDAAAVRTDVPIPKECGIYYYEVTVMSKYQDGLIGLGFSGAKPSLNRLPGWELESWGYHGDDGYAFACSASGKPFGPKFGGGDVVGCGLDLTTGAAFYTKNGVYLGEAFHNIKSEKIYPCVGIKKSGECLRANFGQRPFVFDIDGLVENERNKVRQNIVRSRPFFSPLRDVINLDNTAMELVMQYLGHEGYVEAAKDFTEEAAKRIWVIQTGQDGPKLDSPAPSDVNLMNRQKIRSTILKGDIGKAIKLLKTYFPSVLESPTNRDIYFKLRCRKFIELLLQSYDAQDKLCTINTDEMNEAIIDGNNTDNIDGGISLSNDNSTQEGSNMEIDVEKDNTDDKDLLTQAINYGIRLRDVYINDPDKNIVKALDDTFALLAYTDARQSVLAELLDGKGRVEIAELVNGAILVSLGEPKSAYLEDIWAQTQVLFDMLAVNGRFSAGLIDLEYDIMTRCT